MSEHHALIALCADTIRGEASLRRMLGEIKNFAELRRVSNIYKKESLEERAGSELCVVIRILTEVERDTLFLKMKSLQLMEPGLIATATVLVYDKEVNMVPGSTLPDPRLLQEPLLLVCAAEAWGEYEHPVVAQSLTELVRSKGDHLLGIEFYAQGRQIA